MIPVGTSDAGYISGLFDGEGHVTIARITRKNGGHPSYAMIVGFTNCDLAVLSWLQQRVGGHIAAKTANAKWRQGWELRVRRRVDVAALLALLQQHVKIKARQIEIGLAFLALGSVRGGRPAKDGRGPGVDRLAQRAILRDAQQEMKMRLGMANRRGTLAASEQ